MRTRFVAISTALVLLYVSALPLLQAQAQSRVLHINRGVYGREGRGRDVTARLRAAVRNNTLDVEVNNDTMGGDPNEHTKKTLKVDYTYMGRRLSKVVNEHEHLHLP